MGIPSQYSLEVLEQIFGIVLCRGSWTGNLEMQPQLTPAIDSTKHTQPTKNKFQSHGPSNVAPVWPSRGRCGKNISSASKGTFINRTNSYSFAFSISVLNKRRPAWRDDSVFGLCVKAWIRRARFNLALVSASGRKNIVMSVRTKYVLIAK